MGGAGRGWANSPVASPEGYSYIGGCRCGFGPNAYYRDTSGSAVAASALFSSGRGAAPSRPSDELVQLRAEKAELERRLRDLEDRLNSAP